MNVVYRILRLVGRGIFVQTMKVRAINREVIGRPGGYVLAASHLGNLEPICASILSPREIRWVTRKEFFAGPVVSRLLSTLGAIKIDRQGVCVSAMRRAIHAARTGQVVGIFPEGGVARGLDSVLRGGPIKRGACSIAIRGGVPIVPCVIVGAEKLNRIQPWLPFLRGRLWIAYGDPIHPPAGARSTREARKQMAEQTRRAMVELYSRMRRELAVRDTDVP